MLFRHISLVVAFVAGIEETMIFGLVALAAFSAGFVNAVAGGGSFLTFPALIAAGLPPIDANASSTVPLFPGQIATGYFARDGLAAASADSRINVPVLATISLAGGLIGGLLLLVTPQTVFSRIVPWLILFATTIFAAGSFLPGGEKVQIEPDWHFRRAGFGVRLRRLFRRRHWHSRCSASLTLFGLVTFG